MPKSAADASTITSACRYFLLNLFSKKLSIRITERRISMIVANALITVMIMAYLIVQRYASPTALRCFLLTGSVSPFFSRISVGESFSIRETFTR